MSRRHRFVVWEVLSNENRFGIFFLGAAASNIGTWCQNLATILLIYRLTDSTFVVSLVSVAQFTAPALLSPLAGTVADRVDRRIILTCTQLAGSAVSCGLAIATLTGHVAVPGVLLAVVILGVVQAFQSPAQLSLAPSLVRDDHREIGLSLNSSQFNLARAIGPVVANVIVLAWGIGAAFLFNTATFFAYVVALRYLRPRRQEPARGRPRVRETLALVRSERLLVPLLLVGLVVSGATDVVTTLGPALSVSLTGSDSGTGWLITSFGAGGVVSAFVLVPWLRRFPRRLAALVAVQAMGISMIAAAPALWVCCVGSCLAGGAFLAASNRALSLVQARVPTGLLGRAMGLWIIAFIGGRPIFALLEGSMAEWAGPRIASLVIAVLVFAAALTVHLRGNRWARPREAPPVPGPAVVREQAERPVDKVMKRSAPEKARPYELRGEDES
ncbi:MFS transporter [Streptomyces flaveolus]|uniref:MFS transporter n=1 Tax=Streptomyces flaveolus TaxID=67297 RepID=UPI003805FE03